MIDVPILPSPTSMLVRLSVQSLFAVATLVAAAAQAADIRLLVPADPTGPRPGSIRIVGLPPGQAVTLETRQRARYGDSSLVARVLLVADDRGTVDTATSAARSGSYAGIEPLGPWWSGVAAPSAPDDPPAGQVAVRALVDDRPAAFATASLGPAPTVTIRRDTPFPGAVWAVPGTPGPHPVIVVLGGSEGGSSTARTFAPLFAARGYACLGLPYYDPGYDPGDRIAGLPDRFKDIPVDRLAAARRWLAGQPDADADRIGLWGASKGAEFALIAASRYGWIKAVVAVVPSDLVWEGWGAGAPSSSFAFDGTPLPYERYVGMDAALERAARGEPMDLVRVHRDGRAAHPADAAAARIPIERFRGPLLVAGADGDAIWPSGAMAAAIAATRARAGRPTVLLRFANAGHALGGPGIEPAGPLTALGGDAVGNAHARATTWRATFALFDAALRPRGTEAQ